MLQLKGYQQRSLDRLSEYFKLATPFGADIAFMKLAGRPYQPVPNLADLPYVCLRVPTGGGKTFMATYALGIAARDYLGAEPAVCLWLVPSNVIRDQTLAALRDRQHPYRQALDARFAGNVRVMDLAEALYVQCGTLDGETVIIVSTLAAERVKDAEERKVYESAGALQHHFTALDANLQATLEREKDGTIPYSLANVLRLRRPVVIMDEAHNARTSLSFETLTRFNPSCIIEFTATPVLGREGGPERLPSNVLHHVSAAELKAEHMIKLPIKLQTREDWQQVIADAVSKQRLLEKIAAEESHGSQDYLRPIVLLQAQPQSKGRQTLTPEVVKRALIDDCRVPSEEVAIATGETREIEGVNLFDRRCPIRFIITVQALREGWDCPFAYVLCSVAEQHSARTVEQILGRVLRMPGARQKESPELNWAYAFVASRDFAATAMSLVDGLVENGFQRLEARDFVTDPEGRLLDFGADNLFAGTPEIAAAPREPFRVPALAVREGGQLRFLEEDDFLGAAWDLSERDATLSEAEFPSDVKAGEAGEIDVTDAGRITLGAGFARELQEQLALIAPDRGWTLEGLVNWLDRQILHRDIPQTQSTSFICRALTGLMESRGVTIEQLARVRSRLRDAIEAKIQQHRDECRRKGYQGALFGPDALELEVSPDCCFSCSEEQYCPSECYDGAWRPTKHYFRRIGELKSEGEELQCAMFIDRLPEVKHWVRNLERRPDSSFWLQTPSDRFYPDFVARLEDGRCLVVEYKGEDRWSNDDSKEKRAVGKIWADRSNGTCIFVMPKGADRSAIEQAILGPA